MNEFIFLMIIFGVSTALIWLTLERIGLVGTMRHDSQSLQRAKPFVQVLNPKKKRWNIVAPDNTPLHIKRGWKQSGNIFKGYYRTPYGAWEGEIRKTGDIFKVYIFNPPADQLKKHSRWVCIHHVNKNKWQVDLAKNPEDMDIGAIIYYIEELIIESFQKYKE